MEYRLGEGTRQSAFRNSSSPTVYLFSLSLWIGNPLAYFPPPPSQRSPRDHIPAASPFSVSLFIPASPIFFRLLERFILHASGMRGREKTKIFCFPTLSSLSSGPASPVSKTIYPPPFSPRLIPPYLYSDPWDFSWDRYGVLGFFFHMLSKRMDHAGDPPFFSLHLSCVYRGERVPVIVGFIIVWFF